MMPLLARLTLAWVVGIVLAQHLNLPWQAIALAAIPTLAALLLYQRNLSIRLGAILMIACLGGMFRFFVSQPTINANHIAFYNDAAEPVTLTGLVVAEPDIRDDYINLRLQAESLQQDQTQQPVDGLLLVRAPRYPERYYGERLSITGQLETPPIFEGFDYKDYLARSGIHTIMRRPRITLLASNQGHIFWRTMFRLRAYTSATINRILAEPHASLLNGILLGLETGIPRRLYEQFNATGTSHIIVISGSNIAIVAAVLLLLGQRMLGKRYAPPLAIGGIVLYTLLVGADAAVSRAAVMGVFFVFGMWLGRPGYVFNSLAFSVLILTLINPLILGDVGFQLSFMATFGLVLLVRPLERMTVDLLQQRFDYKKIGVTMALFSQLILVTLAAQIITGPLLVYHFGRFSLVSLLSNLLILPAQPPIMGLGALAALGGMVWLPLGQLLAWLVWLPLAWSVTAVDLTAQIPYGSLDFGTFPLWLALLSYAAIFAGIWWANQRYQDETQRFHYNLPEFGSQTTRLWLGGTSVMLLLVWLAVFNLPDGRLHVAVLDIGQGDAILITLPDGRQLLIDGGPSTTDLNWRLGQEMPFWDRTLEMVINTHPDADHLGGLVSLPDRFALEQVLVSDAESESRLYQEWEAELSEASVVPTVAQYGTQLKLGQGITATILSPGPAIAGIEAANNRSVVLHLQHGRISFLLTGDIEAEVEHRLAQAGLPLQATVLKSPHHGSKTSSSQPFLEAVNPQLVVIPVGLDNRFGHPSPEVLERYAAYALPVLRTDQQGTVEFITDGERLWVDVER